MTLTVRAVLLALRGLPNLLPWVLVYLSAATVERVVQRLPEEAQKDVGQAAKVGAWAFLLAAGAALLMQAKGIRIFGGRR